MRSSSSEKAAATGATGVTGAMRAFAAVEEELDATLPVVEGALPAALRGVYLRNGPGRLDVAGVPYNHPFDGDGMIARFHLDGASNTVRYRNRWVRTREFLDEERAGRMLYRSFGTNLPGGLRRNLLKLRFKNAANTSLVQHGGKLLALWEGGLPHRIDPTTLATLGRETFDGRLRNPFGVIDRLLAPHLPFSAHPRLDGESGELHNFGTLYGRPNRLMLYRVSAGGEMAAPRPVEIDRLAFLHDFVMTPSWWIFFLTPFKFAIASTLLGLRPPVESLRPVEGAATQILMVPRDGGEPRRLEARPCFVFHFAGAWEEADGRVVVDALRLEGFPSAADMKQLIAGEGGSDGSGSDGGGLSTGDYPPVLPTRYVLDPGRNTVEETALSDHGTELPRTHPGRPRHRHIWSIGTTPGKRDPFFRALLHLDTDAPNCAPVVRDFAPDLPGEPLFVPRPGGSDEDDGWVLSLVYRAAAHRTELLVLDARTLSTVARAPLPHHLPPGFHGLWLGEQGGDPTS